MKIYKNPLSLLSILLVILVTSTIIISNKDWNSPKRILYSDALSYYAYLPATNIYHDLYFSFVESDSEFAKTRYWVFQSDKGRNVLLTSMGMSFMYYPFFIVADFIAPLLNFEADGFSIPYKIALIFSSLFYLILGLIFLRKLLLKFFNDYAVAVVIIVIGIGTNLLNYTTSEATMSHAYNFSLITIFLFLVDRWHTNFSYRYSIFIGILAGIISLVRPSNTLVLLLLIFWDIRSIKDIQTKIILFLKKWKHVLIMAGLFILVWIPQFIYWHVMTGSIFYNSYSPSGSSFYFENPQILNQLFSYRKGWFIYTPLMIFAIIGIPLLFKYLKKASIAITLYIAAMIYLLSSWWSWWFGGGFGIRSYIDFYGVLAIPMATVFDWLLNRKWVIRNLALLVITLFIGLNCFQYWQYKIGFIHYDSMTKQAYWEIFLKTKVPQHYNLMLFSPDYELARQGKYAKIPSAPLNKDIIDSCIELEIKKMQSSKALMKIIEQKAEKRGISVDEMLRIDANWICNQKK